jgi:hypothetical protein
MLKRTLIAALVAAVMASTLGATLAIAAGDPQGSVTEAGSATTPENVARCNGGQHQKHKALISNQPLQFDEAAGQVVIGAINFAVPSGRDTIEVDFNAETRLYGAADEGHWIQIDVYLDGVLMNPNDPVSPVAIADDDRGWESNGTSVCQRVRKGYHTVVAKASAVDFYGSANLNAWLDDWTLELDQYE